MAGAYTRAGYQRICGGAKTLQPCLSRATAPPLPMMPTLPAVSTIAQTIQLSLAPVFMLAAIGQLLNVLAGRLARVIDRARALELLLERADDEAHRARLKWELRLLDRRMSIINAALFVSVLSAVMACLVIALLFVANLAKFHIGTWIALAFILSVMMLILCLAAFMIEVRVSLRAIHVRKEILS